MWYFVFTCNLANLSGEMALVGLGTDAFIQAVQRINVFVSIIKRLQQEA